VIALLRAAALLCGVGAVLSLLLAIAAFPQIYAAIIIGGGIPFVSWLFGCAGAGLAFGFAASALDQLEKIGASLERDRPPGVTTIGAATDSPWPPPPPPPTGTRGRIEPRLRG
jgi:hypothetical protein